MCNMLSMIQLIYYTRSFRELQFKNYVGINEPILKELQKQQELTIRAEEEKKLATQKNDRDSADNNNGNNLSSGPTIESQSESTLPLPPSHSPPVDLKKLASTKYFQSKPSLLSITMIYIRSFAALVRKRDISGLMHGRLLYYS